MRLFVSVECLTDCQGKLKVKVLVCFIEKVVLIFKMKKKGDDRAQNHQFSQV